MTRLGGALPTAVRAIFCAADDIPLEQRLVHFERARDIVEAVAAIVGRQQRRDVDVDRQQIADGVAIFGAIQAVERFRAAGIRPCRGRAIQLCLQPRGQGIGRSAVRARPPRGRHQTAAHLQDDLFPDRGAGGDVGQVHGVEGQAGRLQLAGCGRSHSTGSQRCSGATPARTAAPAAARTTPRSVETAVISAIPVTTNAHRPLVIEPPCPQLQPLNENQGTRQLDACAEGTSYRITQRWYPALASSTSNELPVPVSRYPKQPTGAVRSSRG